jgi:hypothetical protein
MLSACILATALLVSIKLAAQSAADLKQAGEVALAKGDDAVAIDDFKQALDLDPQNKTIRELLRYSQKQLIQKETDDLASKLGPRTGYGAAALVLYGLDGIPGLGYGVQVSWLQPDLSKPALGVSLSGWYRSYNRSSDLVAGEQYSGRLLVDWLPGHGRGRRNSLYFHLALGPGFIQDYGRNGWRTQELASPPSAPVYVEYPYTRLDYMPGLAFTIGFGFSSKCGFDFRFDNSSIQAISNLESQSGASNAQSCLSLGYQF